MVPDVERYFFSWRIALAVIAAGIVAGWIAVAARGYAVVHDPGRRIVAATLVFGVERRAMRELAPGYWVGAPQRDGGIVVTCADGRETAPPGSYVTGGARTVVRIGPRTCAGR